ncbi:MAG: helix-turn-helix domain-containing protein [Candidatus Azobacteroides sp.]|nr:helix-turn-helix domain-containing protein [Candidatus Azobacteroides sp.]
MNKFQVIQPSALLAPYVKQYWFVKMEELALSKQRLVPLGCPVVSFHRGEQTYSSLHGNYLPSSHLYGITTEYTDLVFSGYVDFICIVFHPVAGNRFFSVPLMELSNRYASLSSLNDSGWQELEKRLYEETDESRCVDLIEKFLMKRIRKNDEYEWKRIHAVITSIEQGEVSIDRLAWTACLGYKQFKRVFIENTGINPKSFLRITRFQKLHHFIQQHRDMTTDQLAYECDYYDKSHLIKELKCFSGLSPAALNNACDPIYSGYHALFRAAFVDLPSI